MHSQILSANLQLTHPRIITTACEASCLLSLYIASELSLGTHEDLIDIARQKKVTLIREPMKLLRQRCSQSRGMIGLAQLPPLTPIKTWMASAVPSKSAVLLDHIEDPHNVGAIIRSAEEFQIGMLLFPQKRSAPLSDTVARSSAGAMFTMQYNFVSSTMQLIREFRRRDFWVYAADGAGIPAGECDLTGNMLLIVGNEGRGVSSTVKKACDGLVAIPARGSVGSLNVSVAAGILFYERLRQARDPD